MKKPPIKKQKLNFSGCDFMQDMLAKIRQIRLNATQPKQEEK